MPRLWETDIAKNANWALTHLEETKKNVWSLSNGLLVLSNAIWFSHLTA